MALPQPRKRQKMPERKKLEVGQFIASEKDAYKIESILGSGGFGDVYKVFCVKDDKKKFAMKTEYFDARKRKLLNRLKVEMGVFNEIQQAPPARKKHFIQMVDKGQTEKFKFIVMEIVSHSLEDIRKYMLSGKLSWQSAIKVASQTLAAVSDLHSVGYIHRDIKPHNFAIGRPPAHGQIYMLDFGIARRFVEKDGKIRVPRERVTFLGTVKFASRMCHLEQEQARKDDLEVWIYMILELFDQENLVWRRQTDRTKIRQMKEHLFARTEELQLRMPRGFRKIIDHVKKLNFADTPDYVLLEAILHECARAEQMDMSKPLDWIGKPMPVRTKVSKKKPAARLENDEDPSEKRKRQLAAERKAKKAAAAPSGDAKKKKEKKANGEEDEEDEDDDDSESEVKKGWKEPRQPGLNTPHMASSAPIGTHDKKKKASINPKGRKSKSSGKPSDENVKAQQPARGGQMARGSLVPSSSGQSSKNSVPLGQSNDDSSFVRSGYLSADMGPKK